MTNSLDSTLQQFFRFSSFRSGQREVIEHLLAGDSAAAVFPTGAGKSLCYQLPALLLPGLTLVISPLIALMKDQIDALAQRNIAARQLDSSLDAQTYHETMDMARNGQLRMLYIAPERFNNERFRQAMKGVRISLFAIDEAHCISEWGHNFRPDYLKLAAYAKAFSAERILALTATATNQVLTDIRQGLNIKEECAIRTGFYRSNLTLLTMPIVDERRDDHLLSLLQERTAGSTIIYVTQQKTAEVVAELLTTNGLSAHAYHAGMNTEARSKIQDWFMASNKAIVVATIAFGMGVDKSNIRYVYHYNLPKSLENYSQEIGRAGRDGQDSICQMLVCADDLNVLENFVYADTPTQNAVEDLITSLFAFEKQFDLDLYSLSHQHNIRPLMLRTLLTYLELDGYLQGGTPFYSNYQFKPLMSSAAILGKFKGSRRAFLTNLFRQANKARTWFNIDPAATACALNTDRDRIIRALDWLGQQQMLEVKVAGIRYHYERLKTPTNLMSMADDLNHRILNREKAEIGRLMQVLDFANAKRCQTAQLAEHFAERLPEPCGHCSWCLEGNQSIIPRAIQTISKDLQEKVYELRQNDTNNLFQDNHSMALFLCGTTTPRSSRTKLGKHNLFGSLVRVPFAEVLKWIKAM